MNDLPLDKKDFLSGKLAGEYIEKCTDIPLRVGTQYCKDFFFIRSHFRKKPLGELETLETYSEEVPLQKGMSLGDWYVQAKKYRLEKIWNRDRTKVVPAEPYLDKVLAL